MAVDERARHRLYNKAVEILGEEEAAILMAHLPPGGYPNLATKQDTLALRQDIVELEARLDGRMRELQSRLDGSMHELEARLKGHTFRTILVANLSMVVAFAGIAFTAAGLS